MTNSRYVSRREGVRAEGFSRNRNMVRHQKKGLGNISLTVVVSMLVILFGLLYTSESTKATEYDYQIADTESEISDLEAKKEDLSVEKARLQAVATAKNSAVAAAMTDASTEGYAAE